MHHETWLILAQDYITVSCVTEANGTRGGASSEALETHHLPSVSGVRCARLCDAVCTVSSHRLLLKYALAAELQPIIAAAVRLQQATTAISRLGCTLIARAISWQKARLQH